MDTEAPCGYTHDYTARVPGYPKRNNEEKHGKKAGKRTLCLGDGGGGGAIHTWNNNTSTINYLDVSAADEGLVEDGVGEGLR